MYEHFNPLQLENAWLQHLILIAGAVVLGYIIGYLKRKTVVRHLEGQLNWLSDELDNCHNRVLPGIPVTPTAVTPVPEPAPPAEEVSIPTLAAVTEVDDLKKIEGIGPKIEQLLNEAGITTYAQLASSEPAHITSILRAAGTRYQIHDPGTWPAQAKLARDGRWEELKTWQDELNKGKK
ncbi:MAG: DUF4332 domain-containing protein [Siphonobacter sp.]